MTRNAFTFLFCVCASFALYAQDTTHAILKFDRTIQWVSYIHEGDTVEYKFRFVNTGNAPLVISEVVQIPFTPENSLKEPIAPGGFGFVVIRYATAGKTGYFEKTATVKSNSVNGDVVLYLRGEIIPKPSPDAPIIKFDSTTCYFDTVYQGSVVDQEFHFTNKGKTPLIISNVTGSSGSIVPSYSREPVPPGKSGVVHVVFNTTGKAGPQDKTVTVTSNATEQYVVLHIKGYVMWPKPPPPPQVPK